MRYHVVHHHHHHHHHHDCLIIHRRHHHQLHRHRMYDHLSLQSPAKVPIVIVLAAHHRRCSNGAVALLGGWALNNGSHRKALQHGLAKLIHLSLPCVQTLTPHAFWSRQINSEALFSSESERRTISSLDFQNRLVSRSYFVLQFPMAEFG